MASIKINNAMDLDIIEHGIQKQAECYERLMTSKKITDPCLIEYGQEHFKRCTELITELHRLRSTVGQLKPQIYVQD